MKLIDIITQLKNYFHTKIKNIVQLGFDENLESNLKFLKVKEKNTPIQISEDTVNIQGSLNVNGSEVITESNDVDSLNDLSDVTYSSGDLTIDSIDKIISGNITFDCAGTITLDSSLGLFNLKRAGAAGDYCSISVGATGNTTIGTYDSDGAEATLSLSPNGDVIVHNVDMRIHATKKLYLMG